MLIKLKQFLVLGALLISGNAWAEVIDGVRQVPPMPEPIEVFTDGTTSMYMYNVGSGMWFCGGNAWGTQTSIGDTGYRVYMEPFITKGADAWDGTTVSFKDSCLAKSGNIMNVFFETMDGYCFVDHFSQPNLYWKLEKNADNDYYRLSMAEANPNYQEWQVDAHPGTYWGWDSANGTVVSSFLNPAREGVHVDWAFCTISAYDAYQVEYHVYTVAQDLKRQIDLAKGKGLDVATQEAVYVDEAASVEALEEAIAATRSVIAKYEEATVDPDNPVDKTAELKNPDFGDAIGTNSVDGWDGATGNLGNDDTQRSVMAFEYWQMTFDMSQTILGGLPNGTYRIEVDGFSRIGSNEEDYNAYITNPDISPASRAVIYARSTTDPLNTYREAPVKLISAGLTTENLSAGSATFETDGTTYYIPNDIVSSKVWMEAGYYKNVLHVNVTDGTLCLGMKKSEAPESSWVVMDNWKLFYLGPNAEGGQDDVATDKVVISELTVTPGSSDVYSFTVSLQGSDVNYTAYQADLQLPAGMEFAYSNSGKLRVSMVKPSIYPYSIEEEENEEGEMVETKSYTHTLSCNIIEANTLRVAVISTANEVFTATSGDLFKVYVKASPYLKPGDVNIGVKNVKLITADETKYEPADYVSTSVKAETTSTISLKVSAENQYGTCILPFEYTLPTDGSLEAYACSTYNSDVLFLDKVEKMEAYTPYILRSATGFTGTLSGTVDATLYPEEGIVQSGVLVGTIVTKELTEGTYVMQNQGNGTMFYRVGDTPFVLAAGKCYAELPAGISTTVFSLGGTTGIEAIQAPSDNGQQTIYNLSGQPVDRTVPGQIYVIDGQKSIAK